MKKIAAALLVAISTLLAISGADAACYNWSKTAGTNATADPSINWAEGMAPSSVNDSARAMMARSAECRDDLSGSLVTGGTSTAYTLATNQQFDTLAHMDGARLCFRVNAANGTPATLAVDGLTAKPLRTGPSVELVASMLNVNAPYCATYSNSANEWYLFDYYASAAIQPSTITTAMLQNNAVTYGKMQAETTNTILGNVSGGPAVPEEITIGTGLNVIGTTISAPAFPFPGGFKNLSIKVATTTTVAVAADFVTTTDGTNYQTTALSGTVDLGSNGAANKLDTGTIAIDTWYAIWAIAKADGTTAALASASFTAPALPTGYTYKARIGAVQTIHATATLYGTWQFGRRAQYVVGLASTSAVVIASTGPQGAPDTPTWISVAMARFVPTTASVINGTILNNGNKTVVAPNNSYGAASSTTNPPPVASNGASSNPVNIPFSFILESTNIYWASSATNSLLIITGWEDNI